MRNLRNTKASVRSLKTLKTEQFGAAAPCKDLWVVVCAPSWMLHSFCCELDTVDYKNVGSAGNIFLSSDSFPGGVTPAIIQSSKYKYFTKYMFEINVYKKQICAFSNTILRFSSTPNGHKGLIWWNREPRHIRPLNAHIYISVWPICGRYIITFVNIKCISVSYMCIYPRKDSFRVGNPS